MTPATTCPRRVRPRPSLRLRPRTSCGCRRPCGARARSRPHTARGPLARSWAGCGASWRRCSVLPCPLRRLLLRLLLQAAAEEGASASPRRRTVRGGRGGLSVAARGGGAVRRADASPSSYPSCCGGGLRRRADLRVRDARVGARAAAARAVLDCGHRGGGGGGGNNNLAPVRVRALRVRGADGRLQLHGRAPGLAGGHGAQGEGRRPRSLPRPRRWTRRRGRPWSSCCGRPRGAGGGARCSTAASPR